MPDPASDGCLVAWLVSALAMMVARVALLGWTGGINGAFATHEGGQTEAQIQGGGGTVSIGSVGRTEELATVTYQSFQTAHLDERYDLLNIIALGEVMVGAADWQLPLGEWQHGMSFVLAVILVYFMYILQFSTKPRGFKSGLEVGKLRGDAGLEVAKVRGATVTTLQFLTFLPIPVVGACLVPMLEPGELNIQSFTRFKLIISFTSAHLVV